MADENKIGLQAIFESEAFQKGIAEYNSAVSDSTSNTQSGADAMGSAWEGMSAVGAYAWAAVGAAIAAAVAEMYVAIDAAMGTQDVMAELDFQIGKTGDSTGITKDQVLGLADSLSKVLPIDDEVITSAITMGMRFDGVTKDNIEPLIKAAADLAVSTGKTLPGTMRELALAITDPDKAMRLLRDANITLTEAQQKQLKTWKATGNSAKITSFLLGELNGKVGGLADEMGKTASGKMKIMETALGNIQETLGGPLLESLSGVFDKITEFANDPRTIAFIQDLATQVGEVAKKIVESLPSIMTAFQGLVSWLQANQPVVVGVLAIITAAMVAFVATAVAGLVATAEVSVPLIAAIAAIGLIAAVISKAWTENWGDIQGTVAKAWKKMKPTFDLLQKWLSVNIPKALKVLGDFWENVLLPAIKSVVVWIANNVIPLMADLVVWLGDNVPKAIKTLSDFWTKTLMPAIKTVSDWITGTLFPVLGSLVTWLSSTVATALRTLSAIWTGVLLPAIQAVYNFLNSYIIPLFNAVANLVNAVLGVALRVLAGIWQNILLPALSAVWNFISSNLMPIFNSIANVINTVVKPAIETFGNWLKNTAIGLFTPFTNWLNNTFLAAWNGIKQAIQFVIDNINKLITALSNVQIPDILTPGSPTPFEMGLRGINEQLKIMSQTTLPALSLEMKGLGSLRDVQSMAGRSNTSSTVSNSNQSTRNYLFGAQFNLPGPSGLIETLQTLK